MAMGKGVSLFSGETPRGVHVVRVTLLPMDIRTLYSRTLYEWDQTLWPDVSMSCYSVLDMDYTDWCRPNPWLSDPSDRTKIQYLRLGLRRLVPLPLW